MDAQSGAPVPAGRTRLTSSYQAYYPAPQPGNLAPQHSRNDPPSYKVSQIENKMGKYATTINDLVDANESNEDELDAIKAKMVDIEDRSRRNNIKIRGIPEYVQQQDLRKYVSQMFNTIMPDMSALDLTVDRLHRLSHLSI